MFECSLNTEYREIWVCPFGFEKIFLEAVAHKYQFRMQYVKITKPEEAVGPELFLAVFTNHIKPRYIFMINETIGLYTNINSL